MILIICCLKRKSFFLASECILICCMGQKGNTQDTLKLNPLSHFPFIIKVKRYSRRLNAYFRNNRSDRENLTNTTN